MKKTWNVVRASLALGSASIAILSMAGCSGLQMAAVSGPAVVPAAGVKLQGTVLGGNLPVVGATIQLYTAGTKGYGSAAKARIPVADQVPYSSTATAGTTGAMTDSNGSFSITGDYSCPSGSQAYITATGGNPGLGGTVNNGALALIAALGPCDNLSSSTAIDINEVTTVAAVWALQQFIGVTAGTTLGSTQASATPSFSIGTSSTNAIGLANAMQWANVLATTANGTAPTKVTSSVAGSGNVYTPEYWQVNLLGNILAYCVNSDGTSNCTSLFSDTATIGGTAPADTLQAAYAMARNPVYNVNTLFGLAAAQAPFAPAPTSVNDFSIVVTTTPGIKTGLFLDNGVDIKFDGYGNAWVPSTCHGGEVGTTKVGACSNNTGITTGPDFAPYISEFTALGEPIGIPVTNYSLNGTSSSAITPAGDASQGTAFTAVAIDTSNNAWVTDYQDGVIFKVPGSSSAGGLNGDFMPTATAPTSTGTLTYASITSGLATFTVNTGTAPTVGQMIVLSGFTGSSNTFLNNETLTVVTSSGTSISAYLSISGTPSTSAANGLGAGSFTAYPLLYNSNTAVNMGTSSYPYALTIDGNNTLWFATGLMYTDSATVGTWASGNTFPTGAIRAYGGIPTSSGTPGSGFYANVSPGGTQAYQMAVDLTPSSVYAGAPFLLADDGNQGSGYGLINQLFTNGGSVGSTTFAQGSATPLSAFSASGGSGKTKIADSMTASYGGSSTIDAYATKGGVSMLVDGSNNYWILNYNTADSASSNYPKYSLSKITQSTYSASGTGALTEAAAPTAQVYTSNTFGVGGVANMVPSQYMALDGGNNIWLVAINTLLAGSFIEFNNAGTDLTAGTNSAGTAVSNGFIGATAPAGDVRATTARRAVAVDLSGNVWTSTINTGGSSFILLIGQAAPAVAPIASALAAGTIGTRP